MKPTALKIGDLQFSTNLIQGPLAGYSCSAYRELIWNFGGLAYACSEMLSAYDLAHRKQQRQRFTHRADNETTLCVQLAGKQPDILAAATERAVAELQADIIDLNCGCPKPKIRRKGHGSKLTEDPELLYQCILAMRSASDKPLTVKIRLQKNLNHDREVIAAIIAGKADAVIIHPRRWQDDYAIPCDWFYLAECISGCQLPVIANGDITDKQHITTILENTGCAGLMISRATSGRPWLFQTLSDPNFIPPDTDAVGKLLLQHIENLAKLDSEQSALYQARGFIKYYVKWAKLEGFEQHEMLKIDNYHKLMDFLNSSFFRHSY